MRPTKKKTHLYFCGTFRTASSKAFNLDLEKRFKAEGLTCFLPQLHSDQSGDRSRTFKEDIAGIDGAECVVAIGRELQSANWGFEVGYCYAKGIPIIGLTDKDHPFDLMTSGAIKDFIVREDLEPIDDYFMDLLKLVKKFLI